MKRKLWNQSTARASLLGRETETMNPSIAAHSLLGRDRVTRASRKLKTYRRRKAFKNNPFPALLGAVSLFKGLSGRFKSPSDKRAAKVAPQLVAAAIQGNLTAAKTISDRTQVAGIVKERAVWEQALSQVPQRILQLISKYEKQIPGVDNSSPENAARDALSRPFTPPELSGGAVPGTPPGYQPYAGAQSFLATPGAAGAITGVVRALAPRRSSRRAGYGRYPTYTDRYGRQRYSTKPPGSELRIPQGATVTPGTPYNFFTGAVGQGGALATAGQVALGAAAGLGAYLVTQRLLENLGGRAQAKEEAGVNAARALHQALEDYKQQKGAYPPPAERAEMKQVYRDKLVELGYDPDTFTRTRSGLENFLETYNPAGG